MFLFSFDNSIIKESILCKSVNEKRSPHEPSDLIYSSPEIECANINIISESFDICILVFMSSSPFSVNLLCETTFIFDFFALFNIPSYGVIKYLNVVVPEP